MPPWHPHPDVWALVLVLGGGYLYAVLHVGPSQDRPSPSGAQVASFLLGVAALWVASDWPIHDLAEQASFSAHTLEHMVQALVAPPLLLLGTPSWLARRLLHPPPLPLVARALTRPLAAFAIFNVTMLAIHWPIVVGLMLRSEPFHLAAHALVVLAGLVMWAPVLSPLPELPRLSPPLQMVYLFAQSILPTIPASFITFAQSPPYRSYQALTPLWGLSVLEDQQLAGLLMKIGGGLILWTAITIIFFRWYLEEQRWDRLERELRRGA
ncbi:MAG: cytochrome c oxidase assembly protein [Actinomycetota bacterium]|nr:cytochrome c oxidase assembly protein [Actinomycetota bacterium]